MRTCVVVVAVLTATGIARASEVPATFAGIERLKPQELAKLPDLRVPLGQPLAPDRLAGKNTVELRILRNSIFAQCGYKFKTSWLRRYFAGRPWCPKGKYRPGKLKKVDRANFRLIKRRELGMVKKQIKVARNVGGFANIEKLSPAEMKKLPDLRAPLDRKVNPDSLEGMGRIELQILRNSIYAQHGRAFKTRWLQAYFSSRSWYRKGGYRAGKLTATDLANIEMLKRYEYAIRKPSEAAILKIGYCEYWDEDNSDDVYRLTFKTKNGLVHSLEDQSYYGNRKERRCRGKWRVSEDGEVEYRSCFSRNRWTQIQPDPKTHQCF
jgi:hypothetical protein